MSVNKSSSVIRSTQLRSSFQKTSGGITPWLELEVLSREDLVSKLYRELPGVSTLGSKVALMCRIRCHQKDDFVYVKRVELEMVALQEYKEWRLENESRLGTDADPDSLKYLLAVPNFLTGEYLYFGFDQLLSQTKETLSGYIRDHFFGSSVSGNKGQLACRIRVLLRYPRIKLSLSECKAYEEEQAESLRNHLRHEAEDKAQDVLQQQRKDAAKSSRQKQLLITGSFAKHQMKDGSCLQCSSSGPGVECSVCISSALSNLDQRTIGVAPNVSETGQTCERDGVEETSKGGSVTSVEGDSSGESGTKSMEGPVGQQHEAEGDCRNRVDKQDVSQLGSGIKKSLGLHVSETEQTVERGGVEDTSTGVSVSSVKGGSSNESGAASMKELADQQQEAEGDSRNQVDDQDMSQFDSGTMKVPGLHVTVAQGDIDVTSDTLEVDPGGQSGVTGVDIQPGAVSGAEAICVMGSEHNNKPLGDLSDTLAKGSIGVVVTGHEDLNEACAFALGTEDIYAGCVEGNRESQGALGVKDRLAAAASEDGARPATGNESADGQSLGHQTTSSNVERMEIESDEFGEGGTKAHGRCAPPGERELLGARDSASRAGEKGSESIACKVQEGHSTPGCTMGKGVGVDFQELPKKIVAGDAAVVRSGDIVGESSEGVGGVEVYPLATAMASRLATSAGADQSSGVNEGLKVWTGRSEVIARVQVVASDSHSKKSRMVESEGSLQFEQADLTFKRIAPERSVLAEEVQTTIPPPGRGVQVPSWSHLLRECKGAELRGYVRKHYPDINLDCSTPLVAAKIRVLLRHAPMSLSNVEVDRIVQEDDSYKTWFQRTVQRASGAHHVTAFHSPFMTTQQAPLVKRSLWADDDSSSEEEETVNGGASDQRVEGGDGQNEPPSGVECSGGGGCTEEVAVVESQLEMGETEMEHGDEGFVLQTDLKRLCDAEPGAGGKTVGVTSGGVEIETPASRGKRSRGSGDTAAGNEISIRLSAQDSYGSVTVVERPIPVDGDWVVAAAYVVYAKSMDLPIPLAFQDSLRGFLMATLSETMTMLSGHTWPEGSGVMALQEVGSLICLSGWKERLLGLVSQSAGKVISEELGPEQSCRVDVLYEIVYRHIFLRPNMLHFRYGKVFASRHMYQLQIWTVDSEGDYVCQVVYGSGIRVVRWLVRDLEEIPSRVSFLDDPPARKLVQVNHVLEMTLDSKDWATTIVRLECLEDKTIVSRFNGVVVRSSDIRLLASGSMISVGIMSAWCNACQQVNMWSSQRGTPITSTWFLLPSFLPDLLDQEGLVHLGCNVLNVPLWLNDIEDLHADAVLTPHCSREGVWGAGVLRHNSLVCGYIDHQQMCEEYPMHMMILQAMQVWLNSHYATKHGENLSRRSLDDWVVGRREESDVVCGDGYDSGVRVMLDMFRIACGQFVSISGTKQELDLFRRLASILLLLGEEKIEGWLEELANGCIDMQRALSQLDDIKGLVQESGATPIDEGGTSENASSPSDSGGGILLGSVLPRGEHKGVERGSVMAYRGYACNRKGSFRGGTSSTVYSKPADTRLQVFPQEMLEELSVALVDNFTMQEAVEISQDESCRKFAKFFLTPRGVLLDASDFSIVQMAEVLYWQGAAENSVEGGMERMTKEHWAWLCLLSRQNFMTELAILYPAMTEEVKGAMWRRPLDCYFKGDTQGAQDTVLLRYLSITFVEVMDLLCVDAVETSDVFPVPSSSIGETLGGSRRETSREAVDKATSVEATLRLRVMADKLRVSVEDLGGSSLVGKQATSEMSVGMTNWCVVRELDDIKCIEFRQLEEWWNQHSVCDMRLTGRRTLLRPLDVLLRLECLTTDTRWEGGSSGISSKQTHILRSLMLRVAHRLEAESVKIRTMLESVLGLLGLKRAEEAQKIWMSCLITCEEVLVVGDLVFPQSLRIGRCESEVTYIVQAKVPLDRFVVVITSSCTDAGVLVLIPGSQTRQLLLAINRQVVATVAMECIYGIRSVISRNKYWGMPRGFRLSWKEDLSVLPAVIASRQEVIRHGIQYNFDHKPIWMVLGLAPSVDMMSRLCHDDGASFSEKDITSVRCRDSLRVVLASPKAAVVSFSRVETDYPLGIVGVYGRRSFDSMAKDPQSVVASLVRKAREGQSIQLLTVDHYSTPAEYATKTLRSTFSMLQWLCDRNIVSKDTTIEFKNLQASDLVDSFRSLISKEFVVTQLPIECSPWVSTSVMYTEWLRRRGVRVDLDSVERQYGDSVVGQGILRLKWQGNNVPSLGARDTDLTTNMTSEMGLVRFGRCQPGEEGLLVRLEDGVKAQLANEIAAFRKGNVNLEAFLYSQGKFNARRWEVRVYPSALLEGSTDLHSMAVSQLFQYAQENVQYRTFLRFGRKGGSSLCGALAMKLGWGTETNDTLLRVIQLLQNGMSQICDVPWKAKSALEVELAVVQKSLEEKQGETQTAGVSLWLEYGNLSLFERDDQVGSGMYVDQTLVVQEAIRISLASASISVSKVLMALRVDEDSIMLMENVSAVDPFLAMEGVLICVVSKRSDRNEYQLLEGSAVMLEYVSKCMMECAHTLVETMMAKSTWREHMLAWYHKEWKIRVHWSTLPLQVVEITDMCCSARGDRRRRGIPLLERSKKRPRSKTPTTREAWGGMESASLRTSEPGGVSNSSIDRLRHTETVSSMWVVVSGFHASCQVEDVCKQISSTLKLLQLPFEEGQVLSQLKRDQYGETSQGLRMVIVPLTMEVVFSSRPEVGPPFFYSLLSDAIKVRYGNVTRPERFMLMVSPCPSWLQDIRTPAFISRGYAGSDAMDMMLLNGIGWTLRGRLPLEVGEIAFIRVQVRSGFMVSQPGSRSSPIMRYAQETVVLHFTQKGVQQLSPWSWLEQQSGWSTSVVTLARGGKSSVILMREGGGRFDLWKSTKVVLDAGYEHITASPEVVGVREVTHLCCRSNATPTNVSFPAMLSQWEEQGVDLAGVAGVMWVPPRFEAVKGRKRFSSRGSHICVLWSSAKLDVSVQVPELSSVQLDVEMGDCVEGMWRSSVGLDGLFISFIPGNIRRYFVMPEGQTVVPARNRVITELLRTGWGGQQSEANQVVHEAGPGTRKSQLRSSLKRSVTYADIPLRGEVGVHEDLSSTTQESISISEARDDSTISSGGDSKVWQEIAKLRSEITALQQGDGTDLGITRLEARIQQVETMTESLQLQQNSTTEVLAKVQADGATVSQTVARIEGRMDDIRDIKDMLTRQQTQSAPQGWMQIASMMEFYRTQLQVESRLEHTGAIQRLHDGTASTSGASHGGKNA